MKAFATIIDECDDLHEAAAAFRSGRIAAARLLLAQAEADLAAADDIWWDDDDDGGPYKIQFIQSAADWSADRADCLYLIGAIDAALRDGRHADAVAYFERLSQPKFDSYRQCRMAYEAARAAAEKERIA